MQLSSQKQRKSDKWLGEVQNSFGDHASNFILHRCNPKLHRCQNAPVQNTNDTTTQRETFWAGYVAHVRADIQVNVQGQHFSHCSEHRNLCFFFSQKLQCQKEMSYEKQHERHHRKSRRSFPEKPVKSKERPTSGSERVQDVFGTTQACLLCISNCTSALWVAPVQT